jgi:hypothetical protein
MCCSDKYVARQRDTRGHWWPGLLEPAYAVSGCLVECCKHWDIVIECSLRMVMWIYNTVIASHTWTLNTCCVSVPYISSRTVTFENCRCLLFVSWATAVIYQRVVTHDAWRSILLVHTISNTTADLAEANERAKITFGWWYTNTSMVIMHPPTSSAPEQKVKGKV